MSSITLSRALIAGGPEALDAVHDPDIAVAIWERDPLAAIAGLDSASASMTLLMAHASNRISVISTLLSGRDVNDTA